MDNVYFIGIGGIGMSAIARYYKHAGKNVSGYDRTCTKLTQALENEGIQVHYQDDPSLIPINKEKTLVIYTPAVPETLGEMQYVRENGYWMVKRSKALGEIARECTTLAVAGTHGKTTTSTLLGHIYTNSGAGCSAFLGGISKNYHTNLLLSHSNYLVAEADEFDRSFLQLYPNAAIITSTDADHLDIYGNVETMRQAFAEFASQIKSDGQLVMKKGIHLDTSNVKAKIYTYSYTQDADFCPLNIEPLEGGYFKFDIKTPQGVIKECTLGVPGWINIENAIAASAVALMNGISELQLRRALKSFNGVERRMDIHVNSPKVTYIDDYAHHPKELRSAITSIKEAFAGREICGIFQPHLYSRTRDFAEDFAKSLSMLDELILLDIYPARELPIEGVTSQLIFDKVTIARKRMMKKEELMDYIKSREFDVLVTFGAGDIDRFIDPITEALKR